MLFLVLLWQRKGMVVGNAHIETNAPRALRIAPRIAPCACFWSVFYAFLADFQGGRDAVA